MLPSQHQANQTHGLQKNGASHKTALSLHWYNVFNKTTHDEDDSSEDQNVTEIEPYKHNGEPDNGKENKLLTTNLKLKWKLKSGRANNLFHRSTNFKFNVNSGTNQELWELMLIFNQIKTSGQFMVSYIIWVLSSN